MKLFEQIGQEVEARWRQVNYDNAEFPAIATEALRRAQLHRKVTPAQVLEHVLADTPMPPQFDIAGRFGEPPLTMFSNARFIIDVLFWNDGTTAIHEHSFSGAFQVLSGSSVHGVYDFAVERRYSSTFSLGALRLQKMELLRRGDLRPIHGGSGFIHSLFHLDRPSTSIVMRTKQDVEHGTQFSYLPPSIGHGPFAEDERTTRRLDALGALRVLGDKHYFERFAAHADKMELQLFFLALRRHYRPGDRQHMKSILASARKRYGKKAVDRILDAVEEDRRKSWIVRFRARAHSPELRFFLAVMMNAPNRATIQRLIRARYPKKKPVQLMVKWLDRLAELPPIDARYDNALEIPFGDHTPRVLELVLQDKTLDQTIRALAREYDDVEGQRADLTALYDLIYKHPLMATWFR